MSEKDKRVITFEQLEEHEHLLELVDLLPNYPQYTEYEDRDDDDDDDDEDDYNDTKWDFCSPCNLCGKEVNLYQRYYYKCSRNSCDYIVHKWCRELPTTISPRSHRRRCPDGTLALSNVDRAWACDICGTRHMPNECLYDCPECHFWVDVKCAIALIENRMIYHPSHPHPLVRATTHKPIFHHCDACGVKHMGDLYHCTTCLDFSVQSDCLFLPKKKLTAQHTTHHPLILSYSFPRPHQEAEFYPDCRICSEHFYWSPGHWIYKCEKCRYYVHLDCIKSKGGDDFISENSSKNYEESDHPNIVNLPFSDQTESIQKHLLLFFKQTPPPPLPNVDQTHINCHQHPLRLVHTQPPAAATDIDTTIIISCHNPRKKIQLLCDGCVRPITSMPFFQCSHDGCSFVLHEWCTRLPSELHNHYSHPQHTLTLLPKLVPGFGVFPCRVCRLLCNGFAYGCETCDDQYYYIDVTCAFMPQEITHEAHPNHLFFRVENAPTNQTCLACLRFTRSSFAYKCRTCEDKDVCLHPECALLLPKTITHKYDKHPMKLSYMPIQNHKSEYFCEICEEKLNPNRWFYHCDSDECRQSVHSACAPLILDSERDVYSWFGKGVYEYVNIKFGSVFHDIALHSHSLLFAQGIHDDGPCIKCGVTARYRMVFKCLPCKFVIHYACVFHKYII